MKHELKLIIVFIVFSFVTILQDSCKNKGSSVIVNTENISGITQTEASASGYVKIQGKNHVKIKGVCWSEIIDPTIADYTTNEGSGAGSFASMLTNLNAGTEYFVRAYVITEKDTIYGNNISFSTKTFPTISDVDGNIYVVVTIGKQVWMAENLRTTRYNDSTEIPSVKDDSSWTGLTTPAYCWYKNEEEAFKPAYGGLYNWFAVKTGKLCPVGWHVPDDSEWARLSDHLGGENIAGGKLKVSGTDYWVDPNSGASNESGFSAFPGGFRYHDGKFFDFGFSGYWWTSTEFSEQRSYFRMLYFEDITIHRFDNLKKNGFSVRCVKD
ncbi:MAG: hypothetical protein GYA43_07250 [Bacteroidales bacterium]|nr:hypothetical protein [Bacteroidales bacterium]